MARSRFVLAVSLTLVHPDAEACTAWVAESTSCDSSASHACALGSDASGSASSGEEAVGELGADDAEDALDEEGGGLAGGPMSPGPDLLAVGEAGHDEAVLVTRPGMTALARRTRAVLTDRVEGVDGDDDVPVDGDVEVADVVEPDVDADTARLAVAVAEADDAADDDDVPARFRDACGDTVDSCS